MNEKKKTKFNIEIVKNTIIFKINALKLNRKKILWIK